MIAKKRLLPILVAVLMVFAMMPISAFAGVFQSPTNGKVYSGAATVTIKVAADEYKECEEKQNYCEVVVYSMPKGGLKVLEQSFPYTVTGQVLSTSFSASEIGDYYVYTSCYYLVNGFKNYLPRSPYLLNGQQIWASGVTKFTIDKKANPLKIIPETASVMYSKLKKKTQTLAVTKVMKFTKDAKDKKTYTLVSAKKGSNSFKKYFKINKTTGEVTVKKGLKKGIYKVKVKVKAAGNANYKASGTKTVTFTVNVK
jgi:hypothetical protein